MNKLNLIKNHLQKQVVFLFTKPIVFEFALQPTNEYQTKCTNISALIKLENHPSAKDDFLVL